MEGNDNGSFFILTTLLTAELNHGLHFFQTKYENNFIVDGVGEMIINTSTIDELKAIKFSTVTIDGRVLSKGLSPKYMCSDQKDNLHRCFSFEDV
jgi:hypothetical protein